LLPQVGTLTPVERREVVIAGASFAGLACAAALAPERDVLVLDRRPVGEGETSACALPVSVVRYLGLEDTIEEQHGDAWVWVRERSHRFRLPEPFCTITYRDFCTTLAERGGHEVRVDPVKARAGEVLTLGSGAEVTGRFVVDAAGWRRVLGAGGPLDADAPGFSIGAEEHVAYPGPRHVGGLHFYVRRDMVERGYGWNFPSGDHARAGIGSYRARTPLAPGMQVLRGRDSMAHPRARQGGVIPHLLREPVEDGVLFVGDAAGQCLPLTAEGIRTAVAFGAAAGELLDAALAGWLRDDEARARYAAAVERHAAHYRALLRYQRLLPALPPRLLAAVTRGFERTGVGAAFTRRYLDRIRPGQLAA
jgi:menaquinone-9 beta-reductase